MMSRFVVLLSIIVSGLSLPASPQASSPASPPLYSPGPITDYSAAVAGTNDVLRLRRGQRYNSPDSQEAELGDQSEPLLIGADSVTFHRDPLPFHESDAAVVGNVTSGQAYLSEDKRDVYSEFNFAVTEALKSSSAHYVQPGDNIDIQRYGGAIRLPSGKVIVRGLRDFSMPLVGKRYLLFLKYNPSTEDFDIVTGYQLEGEHTYKLDSLQNPGPHDKLIHPLREQGQSEQQFLNRVKAMKSPNQGEK